jgi:hypothetical protein
LGPHCALHALAFAEVPLARHFPSPRGARPLAGILLCGARTFLSEDKPPSDCLADFAIKFYHRLREILDYSARVYYAWIMAIAPPRLPATGGAHETQTLFSVTRCRERPNHAQ